MSCSEVMQNVSDCWDSIYPIMEGIIDWIIKFAPTIVALYAVYKNNKEADKREIKAEKRNKINFRLDRYEKLLYSLQDETILIMDILDKTHEEFVDSIKDETFDSIKEYRKLVCSARALFTRSEMAVEVYNNTDLNFFKYFDMIYKFYEYVCKVNKECEKEFKELTKINNNEDCFREVKDEIFNRTVEISNELFEYIKITQKAYKSLIIGEN